MNYDLAEIPFYAHLKREYGLTTSAVLLYGAIVAFTRVGVSPKLRELAYVAGLASHANQLRAWIADLEAAGLIERDVSRGPGPSRFRLMLDEWEPTSKSPGCSSAA